MKDENSLRTHCCSIHFPSLLPFHLFSTFPIFRLSLIFLYYPSLLPFQFSTFHPLYFKLYFKQQPNLTCTDGSSIISPSTFHTLFRCSLVLSFRVKLRFRSGFFVVTLLENSSASSSLSQKASGRKENSFTRWTSTKSKSNYKKKWKK